MASDSYHFPFAENNRWPKILAEIARAICYALPASRLTDRSLPTFNDPMELTVRLKFRAETATTMRRRLDVREAKSDEYCATETRFRSRIPELWRISAAHYSNLLALVS